MTELASRLAGMVELLLAFGMLFPGRVWRWLYAVQSVVIAVSSVAAAAQANALWPLAAVPVLLAQAAAVPRLLRGEPHERRRVARLAAGLLLAVLAAAAPFGGGFAVPLSMVLLGLLAAATGSMRHGVLLLLTGAQAALCLPPANPAGPLAVLALAGFAAVAATDGVPRWGALR